MLLPGTWVHPHYNSIPYLSNLFYTHNGLNNSADGYFPGVMPSSINTGYLLESW